MVAQLKDQHWRVLELAATTLYLQRTKRLAPAEAFERAGALKPACREYREPASRVLQELWRYAENPSPRGGALSGV
jgi:hypothetical protein